MSRARVPVLTWHSMSMDGMDYSTNDHIAFAQDLRTIHRLGLRIVSLAQIARAIVEGRLDELEGCVGLSLDDGADPDYFDFPHPVWGAQRSMRHVLADFRAEVGDAQTGPAATAFAIASPDARAELDRTCMQGLGWWNDGWWAEADAEGLVTIESHSWDHNHIGMAQTAVDVAKGSFDLTTRAQADAEIARASRFVRERRGRGGDVLFAYPYGPASGYLAREYFPDASADHGVYAAFTVEPRPVTAADSRWTLPRYMCRAHWRSSDELEKLLADAGAVAVPRKFAAAPPAAKARSLDWRRHLRTWEVRDASRLAGELFRKSFGHGVPDYPRHFVLLYSPPDGDADAAPRVVAYVHHMRFGDVYLGGGLCVDPAAYRSLPKAIFAGVRDAGGLATVIVQDSFALLDGAAVFERVGDLRSLAATKRAGFEETGREKLLAHWMKPLSASEKETILDRVEAHGPF